MPKQSKAKWNIDTDNFVVNLQILASGENVTFDLNDLSAEMVNHAALHGVKQLLGDSFAAKDANPADTTAKKWATLAAGEWSAKREGSGPRISMLVEELSQTAFGEGKTLDEIAGLVEKGAETDDKFKANLRKNPEIDAILKIMAVDRARAAAEKAEKAAETVAEPADVSAMFT